MGTEWGQNYMKNIYMGGSHRMIVGLLGISPNGLIKKISY